ncbi:heparan-alpha-glucosaminide N-acetyltransferase domain-containing protein [Leucobacter soli]|uniref:heparan-alpha-glucosaminide N-acetyltransferase domain-containing protein n=1 Tax=Leucobacter soli TaxID=2812850 RepID=UPI003622810E
MTSTATAQLRRRIARNWHRLNGPGRVAGVDLARGLAVLGMLAAHLLWLGSLSWTEPSTWGSVVTGRSSILFAALAGVSLGLSTGGPTPPHGAGLGRARLRVTIRALLIWLLGVLLISFDVPAAIILPTYAIIFVLTLPLLAQRASRLFLAAAIVVLVTSPLIVWANASPWWESYKGWLLGLYIGWNYPFPLWIAFTLAGLGLARAGIRSRRVQWAALSVGALLAVAGYSLSPARNRRSRRLVARSSRPGGRRTRIRAACSRRSGAAASRSR